MKALTIVKQGSPAAANIAMVDDWPEPSPGPAEVMVRTEASALNHLDLWVVRGLPGLDLEYPRIGGSDGAGVVETIGENVHPSWIGRRVVVNARKPVSEAAHPDRRSTLSDITMIGEHDNGTHAAKFIAPVENLVEIGDSDPVKAAAFALTHLTAWRMLRTRAGLEPGMTVLITGIGGGVALAALNICKHFGCHTVVTSRHQWKLDRAMELGAHDGVLDKGSDWSREVRALTGKRGVDICIDSIGKQVHTSCIKSLARGGVFVTCGTTTGPDAATDLARIFWNQLTIIGSTMGTMDEFREVLSLFRNGAIEPVIDQVFDAKEGNQAYARLESGEQFGKIVIRWT